MVMMAVEPAMEVESSRSYMDDLYSQDEEAILNSIVQLKNAVIGSNKQKWSVISGGTVPRLLQLLGRWPSDPACSHLQVEVAITLGSLAKGDDRHVHMLVDCGIVPLLISRLRDSPPEVVTACLCCLRTIFLCDCTHSQVLYADSSLIPHLISLIPNSHTNQECICNLLNASCKTEQQQNLLLDEGLVSSLAELLPLAPYRVQVPALKCLATICYQNPQVSHIVSTASFGGKSVPDTFVELLARDQPVEMRLCAAKCLTYLYRSGAISAQNPKIQFKTLPCLVRLCKKDCDASERVEAAETLSYLIEVSAELQKSAAISDHLMSELGDYLNYQPANIPHNISQIMATHVARDINRHVIISKHMKAAAFKCFGALASNDEDIRKRLIEIDGLMDSLVSALQDESPKVRLGAVRCLHSLSRSVQQLRTTLQDHLIWKPFMKVVCEAQDELLVVSSSTLCNLLLEFSPCKEIIVEHGAIDLLCGLTHRDHSDLKLNGIWGLMNMGFQAEQKVKTRILSTLGIDHMFQLLVDTNKCVLMKTLGLLRNLLTTKPHIDYIMSQHGKKIMQAVVLVLEAEYSFDVKEQALCILSNIADGDSAKDLIMTNEDVLKKLMNYMMHSNLKLQIAATFCMSNLLWSADDGASLRQAKLQEMGVYKLLQSLLTTEDTILFDKVKTALQQFS